MWPLPWVSRKRKGTLALLESLANDVAGWPARAVESYTSLGWTQHINHLRLGRGKTVSLRDGADLDLIDSPFETLAHTADVRRIALPPLARTSQSFQRRIVCLAAEELFRNPCACLSSGKKPSALFHIQRAWQRCPVIRKAPAEAEPTSIADEINLPTAIRRRGLEERLSVRPLRRALRLTYYGKGKSIAIYAPGWQPDNMPGSQLQPQPEPQPFSSEPIPANKVIPADLSEWRYRVEQNQVALDPVLGRILFPPDQPPEQGVWVSYHYGFSADIGGGEYKRDLSEPRIQNFTGYRRIILLPEHSIRLMLHLLSGATISRRRDPNRQMGQRRRNCARR